MRGNRIKERRIALKMTQQDLADKADLSRATISALENGEGVDIKVSTLKALADALKCKPHSLFT